MPLSTAPPHQGQLHSQYVPMYVYYFASNVSVRWDRRRGIGTSTMAVMFTAWWEMWLRKRTVPHSSRDLNSPGTVLLPHKTKRTWVSIDQKPNDLWVPTSVLLDVICPIGIACQEAGVAHDEPRLGCNDWVFLTISELGRLSKSRDRV